MTDFIFLKHLVKLGHWDQKKKKLALKIVSSTNMREQSNGPSGRKSPIYQSGRLCEKSHILLHPQFLTLNSVLSNRQEVQKHKGNQYENCESLLINQCTNSPS